MTPDGVVDVRPLIFAAVITGAAAWCSVWLWRRRLDREPHGTLLRALGVAGLIFFVLLLIAAGLRVDLLLEVASVWFLAVLLVGIAAAGVVEVRQSRERRALRRSAGAVGEPGKGYQRRPRHPLVIGGLYLSASAALITGVLAVFVLVSAPAEGWLVDPVRLPASPTELPLWMVAPMVLIGCGFVHALVNDLRR